MKVLSPAEMQEVDQRSEELGLPGLILMENAGHRAVEFLIERFGSPQSHRIVVLCGKGNNGGDGYVIARQLWTRLQPAALHVVSVFPEDTTNGPRRMLEATGCAVQTEITAEMRLATLVVDAVLGTGVAGAARGRALDVIREINLGFPLARVLAVDVPSGMNAGSGASEGEVARADACITFTAPKPCHVLPPNCDRLGTWRVGHIGSPASLLEHARLHLNTPAYFADVLRPRPRESNKGTYGHVLVVGGAEGKTGAAEMTGLAALRAGAGLVTVAASRTFHPGAPELMTASIPAGIGELTELTARMNVIAIGPGLGTAATEANLVRDAVAESQQAMVLDADALNLLAGQQWRAPEGSIRVLTPHPGEMARLTESNTKDVQANRLELSRTYAAEHGCTLVLKGHRSIIALPDGRAWVNPTGSPGMATGGSGDILTGLIAGLLAQYPSQHESAVLAAVYLHGLAGQIGARALGEQALIATDLLSYLPEAVRECPNLSHPF